MDNSAIISTMNQYIHDLTVFTCKWLARMLPFVGKDWWDTCVLDNLTDSQLKRVEQEGIDSLEKLDLAALLRIATYSWFNMINAGCSYLTPKDRYCFKNMIYVRNRWAHMSSDLPSKEEILEDIQHIRALAVYTEADFQYLNQIRKFSESVESGEETAVVETKIEKPEIKTSDITLNSVVRLVSDPDTMGVVMAITPVGDDYKYSVFVNGSINTYFAGQVMPNDASPSENVINRKQLLSNITAYQIKHPSQGKLYSLNAAKIDFVPYQFRPVMKMIKNEVPRLLIADSVGVGKTIEAGLVLKEMEARSQMDRVLIICPKPLVAERKWELEMKRFDEDFTPVDGKILRQILSDYDRDGDWPARYDKCIIPYSLLTEELMLGNGRGRKRRSNIPCLAELDPLPHFDMVIVDEAHHIRNCTTQAYKCVEYFCENSDAVLFLTATPIQMGNHDLYTLLHLLRNDLIPDPAVFREMSEPNRYINEAARTVRNAEDGWQENAYKYLADMTVTEWGNRVISKDPVYKQVMEKLQEPELERSDKVQLISSIEGLNSFSSLINRTRRKDIQDFCERGTRTVSVDFTPYQLAMYNALLEFEAEALLQISGNSCVEFMMTTLKRQAASCIFGLEGSVKDLIGRRMFLMSDEFGEEDFSDGSYSEEDVAVMRGLSEKLLSLASDLPDNDDPKLEALLSVVKEKQTRENNKIIIFSCFRHTLKYLRKHLIKAGYRVGYVDGSVRDDDRFDMRTRFAQSSELPDSIDIMLFTEVGSEGLDYQFCDMIINYDLPWNPMRIEQRIGRIDRRGQKSEKVQIINMITEGTIDASIYYRCLARIGVFESNIGDCDEILGEITKDIKNIATNSNLTPEEKERHLEIMTDNKVRSMNELKTLEEDEKNFVGFDLAGLIMNNEMKNADDIFISPTMLQHMIESYLSSVAGEGKYISGDGPQKNLRLSEAHRVKLLEDFRKLGKTSNGIVERNWKGYLKSTAANVAITFDSEYAASNPNVLFITTTHPLTKQAANHFKMVDKSYAGLVCATDEYPEGIYPFGIYSWEYRGYRPEVKLIPVCADETIENQLFDIITNSDSHEVDFSSYEEAFEGIDCLNMDKWKSARRDHIADVNQAIRYKEESLKRSFVNKKAWLETQMANIKDPKILTMREHQLENEEDNYQIQLEKIRKDGSKIDIMTNCLIRGVLEVRKG